MEVGSLTQYTNDLMAILRDPPVPGGNLNEEAIEHAREISLNLQWPLVTSLCRIEPESVEMLPVLEEALFLVGEKSLQTELLNAIGGYASIFDEGIQLLVDLTSDANDHIAVGAVESLGRAGADNDEMFPVIFDLTGHINQKVADSAVKIVCEHWLGEPGVLERITEIATNQYGPAGITAGEELLKGDDLPLEILIDILIPKVGTASKSIKDAVYERGEK